MLTRALIAEAMGRAREGEGLSAQELESLQQRKLRELVRFAAGQSPFYRQLYRGIDLDRATLTELPAVNKETIQDRFDEVVTDPRLRLADIKRFCHESSHDSSPWYLETFLALLTSGTTGRRANYVWDLPMLADAIAMGYRQSNRPGPATGPAGAERIAAVIQIDPTDASNILMSMIPESAGTARLIDIRQDLAAICRQLNDFQPTLLASYPYLLWLLSEAARDGRLSIKPKRITSSADVLTASDRRSIRTAFGVEPYNYYCSTEFPYLAWECDSHDGLHVNADYLILESVDADNRPVPPGALGDKVLVTSLSNRAMPLVRYEMSDQVEYATSPCPCGCRLPRVRTVAGRVEHVLTLPGPNGARVPLLEEHVDDIVGRLDVVATYQVIQEDPTRLTVNIVGRDPSVWDQVKDQVREALGRSFQMYGVDASQVRLDLRPVETLEPEGPGSRKVCRFWNRCR